MTEKTWKELVKIVPVKLMMNNLSCNITDNAELEAAHKKSELLLDYLVVESLKFNEAHNTTEAGRPYDSETEAYIVECKKTIADVPDPLAEMTKKELEAEIKARK